jgi:hypothetical protein
LYGLTREEEHDNTEEEENDCAEKDESDRGTSHTGLGDCPVQGGDLRWRGYPGYSEGTGATASTTTPATPDSLTTPAYFKSNH